MPPVTIDKHRVLQILINLIRNAKHAMDATGREDKMLVLRTAPSVAGRVQIIVQDNGVGISSENLMKIFHHGFTTKKDGHGFGLHSSINAAREMHGDLRVHSNGLGAGAVFTLELPVAHRKEKQTRT